MCECITRRSLRKAEDTRVFSIHSLNQKFENSNFSQYSAWIYCNVCPNPPLTWLQRFVTVLWAILDAFTETRDLNSAKERTLGLGDGVWVRVSVTSLILLSSGPNKACIASQTNMYLCTAHHEYRDVSPPLSVRLGRIGLTYLLSLLHTVLPELIQNSSTNTPPPIAYPAIAH